MHTLADDNDVCFALVASDISVCVATCDRQKVKGIYSRNTACTFVPHFLLSAHFTTKIMSGEKFIFVPVDFHNFFETLFSSIGLETVGHYQLPYLDQILNLGFKTPCVS